LRRILHVIANLDMGGAEMDLIAKTLALRNSHAFRVVTLQHKGALAPLLEDAGIEVTALEMKSRWDVTRGAQLGWFFAREPADILHAHMQNAFWASNVARLANPGVPIVYTIQKDAPQAGRIERRLDRSLMPFAAAITMPSLNVRRSYRAIGLDGDKVRVVYNCVDFSRLEGGDARVLSEVGVISRPLLGAVGRLLPVKGHRVLLEALPAIRREFPSLSCVLIGDGSEAETLRALAQRLGVADCVHWLGTRTDVQNFLPFLDVVVMPSLSEAFGIAAAEALGCGVPVIASRVGGLSEVVDHGKTGLLVEAGDAVALASAVLDLLRDDGKRRAMGENGKSSALRFSAERLARDWARIYDEVSRA
jgi:glycosyltransferase involved in cell wall biosynthesis